MTPQNAAGTAARSKELTPENADERGAARKSPRPVTAEGHQNVPCAGGRSS